MHVFGLRSLRWSRALIRLVAAAVIRLRRELVGTSQARTARRYEEEHGDKSVAGYFAQHLIAMNCAPDVPNCSSHDCNS